MGRLANDTAYWQVRAEEARVVAENMKDPESRTFMLSAARSYAHLAQLAEERELLKDVPVAANDRQE
jgi:hypothetical protein